MPANLSKRPACVVPFDPTDEDPTVKAQIIEVDASPKTIRAQPNYLRDTHNKCIECERKSQILLNGEPINPKYVCSDCRARPPIVTPKTLAEMLADTRFIWRCKFTMLGLRVARRGFMVNRNGVLTELFHGWALDLKLLRRPHKQDEYRYSFHLNLDTGEWNRAGLSVRTTQVINTGSGRRVPHIQTHFSYATLKHYGVEAVVDK